MEVRAKTGHDFEEEFFGVSSYNFAPRSWYLDLREGFKYVKKNQPPVWDPAFPRTPLAIALFKEVERLLPDKYAYKLKLFCAIASPLDFHHQIDAFFEIIYNRVSRVTIDITVRDGKKNKSRLSINKK